MPTESYEFLGSKQEVLSGKLEIPNGRIKAYAVFAHCFTGTKDFIASKTICQALAQRGIATLRFDFTGLGGSGGDFSNTDFSSNIEDLIFASEALGSTHVCPKILIGHSLGGAAILGAAPYLSSVKAVATLAAPYDPSHVAHLFAKNINEICKDGRSDVDLYGRRFTITRKFIEDLNSQDQKSKIASLKKALLVMHSPTDQTVGVENAKMIFAAAQHPKSFVSLDDMDHLLMNPKDVPYVAEILSSWASRYITNEAEANENAAKGKPKKGEVRVSSLNSSPFAMEVQTDSHTFIADEPMSVGGKNSGPNPYDFLLASVGTCTAMTLKMYANYKKMKLDDVEVVLKQERIHNKDCENCGKSNKHAIHEITREISVKGDLTEEQRNKILEIADKCPVHKTLEGKVEIKSILKKD